MFITKVFLDFFVAFGVVLGGTVLGGLGAYLVQQPPLSTMLQITEKIKIWALIAAVGGTVDVLRVIETNFLDGELSSVVKQVLYILSAFAGAHTATVLLHWILKGEA